jgi:predicted dehydrogenase
MLESETPDGVIICVAAAFHAEAAAELMNAGYHVYTEKPPAVDLNQCKKVLATQRKTGRICMTAFKKRFAPAYVKTKELLGKKEFGDPAVISILRTSAPFKQEDPNSPRSVYLLESGIHVIDLACYLCGPVATVAAARKPVATFAVSMQFTNGAVGTMSLTDRMSYDRGWEQVTLIGAGGMCVQIDNSVEMMAFCKDRPIAAHKPEFVSGSSHSSVEMGFVGELQAFVDAIAAGGQPESNIEQATHTMAVLEAIQEAVRRGTSVSVEATL